MPLARALEGRHHDEIVPRTIEIEKRLLSNYGGLLRNRISRMRPARTGGRAIAHEDHVPAGAVPILMFFSRQKWLRGAGGDRPVEEQIGDEPAARPATVVERDIPFDVH